MLKTKNISFDKINDSFISKFSLNYGIGENRLKSFLCLNGVNCLTYKMKAKKNISKIVEKHFRNSLYSISLMANKKKILNFFWSIRIYRGFRFKFKLPARGQRTKTNSKTKKKIKNL